jgi:hypothetical protein
VNVAPDHVRQWFSELDIHPERYRFDTHAGFDFTSGSFGEIGAQFRTQERFRGIPVTLRFELMDLQRDGFSFRLIRPALPVWGAFLIEQAADGAAAVTLQVGEDTPQSAWFLRLHPVRAAVQHQIDGEMANIKSSIERTFPPPQP